jgi:hypothetical protein
VDRYFVLLTTAERNNALRCDEWKEFVIAQDPETIQLEGYVIYIFNRNIEIEIP